MEIPACLHNHLARADPAPIPESGDVLSSTRVNQAVNKQSLVFPKRKSLDTKKVTAYVCNDAFMHATLHTIAARREMTDNLKHKSIRNMELSKKRVSAGLKEF